MSDGYERLSICSDLSELDRLFDFLRGFCARNDIADDIRHRLFLVTEELAVNVIEHGCGGRDDGRIEIGLKRHPRRVELVVEDDGARFDPFAHVPPPDVTATLDQRPIGGLGIHLVRSLTVDTAYRFEDGRNVVRALIVTAD